MNTFTLQLISSFVLGGALIALQSLASERVPKAISGIILSLPSTIIVNFFFLGHILGPEEFQNILPVVPAPLGVSLIFIIAYVYIAKWLYTLFYCKPQNIIEAIKQTFFKPKLNKTKKLILIIISSILASAIWLAFSLPFAIYEFQDTNQSLMIFLILVVISKLIIDRGCKKYRGGKPLEYTTAQHLSRAAFAGLMVATTVYLGKTMGAFWGGVIAMFPAAFLAAMAIFHYYYDHEKIFQLYRTTPIGISTLVVYAFVADYSFPIYGVNLGTLMSIFASSVYSFILSKILSEDSAGR